VGDRYRFYLMPLQLGLDQCRFDDGQNAEYVLPGCQFRKYPAVALVDVHLRSDHVAVDSLSVSNDCRRGLITRCFDAQNKGHSSLRSFADAQDRVQV